MNNLVDLIEILKHYPYNCKLYSTAYGEVQLREMFEETDTIMVALKTAPNERTILKQFDRYGRIFEKGECCLFLERDKT